METMITTKLYSWTSRYDLALLFCYSSLAFKLKKRYLTLKIEIPDRKNRENKISAKTTTNMAEAADDADSEIFRINNKTCAFSLCGDYFAIAFQNNLYVKKIDTLDNFRTFDFVDIIEYIEWSPNSQFLLCANIKKTIVQIYSIYYPEWRWKLVEGSAGMERVTWAPDNLHIITTADFNVQISVWNLETRSVVNIQNLKSMANETLAFSPNYKYLAVIATDNGADCVEIYKTDGWKISRKLLCEKLTAIDGVSWSPNSELLCMWCSISGNTKLLVYSTVSDSHVGAYSPEESSSKNISDAQNVELYKGPRGIDKVSWNSSGQLLAIAAHNETIALLNYITWKPILELHCDPVIKETDYLGRVYKECIIARDSNVNFGHNEKHTMEEVNDRPINIAIATNGGGDGLSIAAVDIFEFSSCGRYLAIRHQVYPSTMWIWDIAEDSVDHLLLKRSISGICWHPSSPRLMVFTEYPLIFEWWAGRSSTCYPSPRGITILTGRWHSRGKILAVCGYNKTAIIRLQR